MQNMTMGNIQFGNNSQKPETMAIPQFPPFPIKIYSESKHELPKYETSGASGMDLKANEAKKIYPSETTTIGTGIYVELPGTLEFQIRPRSGLSLKTGLRVVNSPGTIDSCYRGEIRIILQNTGSEPIDIKDGDRIAQMVLVPVLKAGWQQVQSKEQLSDSDRGENGFGSTGTK